ncbi:MAG: RagB/SusD family nutrient uptake outer membrane protein [Chitinophagaceae bacterium]
MKHFFFLLIVLGSVSCKKFLVVDAPPMLTTTDYVFASDATAIATIDGIYSAMQANGNQFSAGAVTFYAGLSSDELLYYSPSSRDLFASNDITEASHSILEDQFWNPAFNYIYTANLTLDKLNGSTGVSDGIKKRLTGEAKFIRAFCYFYLVNLFGDVPLALAADYRINEKLPRADITVVYGQIKSDLREAITLLPESNVGNARVRPSKWAAMAMLSRVCLYTQQWKEAETAASAILASNMFQLTTSPASVFGKASPETIWQLQPVQSNIATWEASEILPSTTEAPPSYIIPANFVNLLEAGDTRGAWFSQRLFLGETVCYPTKYKQLQQSGTLNEYYVVLRLAEQYLIRAEARSQLGLLDDGVSDVNEIRIRASLSPVTINNKADLELAIERERRVELAAEWGHRWMDLKRTNRASAILAPVKPLWGPTDVLWPIPLKQLQANPQLVQNDGY